MQSQQSPNPSTQQLQPQAVTQTQQSAAAVLMHQQQQQQTQLLQNQGNTVGKINDTPNLSTVGKFPINASRIFSI